MDQAIRLCASCTGPGAALRKQTQDDVFERFGEKARRVIFFARYEAGESGSPEIEPGHLLIGLLREDRELFDRLPIDQPDASLFAQTVQSGLPEMPATPPSVDLALSHASKRTLAYSVEEAERLASKTVDTIHVLLGLLREDTAVSERLQASGLTVEDLRTHALASKREDESRPSSTQVMDALRREFHPVAARLAYDVEPALTYALHQPAETAK